MELLTISEEDLQRFGEALAHSWDILTCWPGCWDQENPQAGHCRATAAVTQDHFGGDILFAHVSGGTHYWNLLPDGREQDFTRGQFPKGTEIPPGEIRTRKEVMDALPMESSYQILSERVNNFLTNAE